MVTIGDSSDYDREAGRIILAGQIWAAMSMVSEEGRLYSEVWPIVDSETGIVTSDIQVIMPSGTYIVSVTPAPEDE